MLSDSAAVGPEFRSLKKARVNSRVPKCKEDSTRYCIMQELRHKSNTVRTAVLQAISEDGLTICDEECLGGCIGGRDKCRVNFVM
ncbi:unnamed protein product [Protopolystoma xenopodis]|uniref:Uncharacterized protein n=1 Tax=Protopolystoma xenopodis TaxID=117903 RepID=A0A3S5AMD7_9PLAT|nr:unnamed protein product [Protopolystoma xenopodis]